MRKKAILALVLAAAMILSSCALVEKDAAVDNATVIIELGNRTFNKAQVNNALDYQLSEMASYYSMFGMSIDPTDPAVRSDALDGILHSLSEELVKQQKIEELGFDVFTSEEDIAIKEAAQTAYDDDKEFVKAQFFADTTLEGEALETALQEKMTEFGITLDMYYDTEKAQASEDKLREHIVKDVTVTDEEIQTEFDTLVETAKTNYESNLSAYGSALNNGTKVYYAPAGYRYVKHILRKFPDDVQTAINDLYTKLSSKADEITSVDSSITALGEDVAQDAPERVTLNEQKAKLEAEKAELQTQYDKALEDAYAQLQPQVDEVLAKIAAGEDFDALMEAYGEDPGMKSSPLKETGYAVCAGFESFDPAFTDAAMALASIGDVSPAVRGQSGIHIIKYVSDIAEGPVSLDTVKETLSAELLSTKQSETYSTVIHEWEGQSSVKIYKDRMN